MADDLSMAQGLLAGHARIKRQFARRYRDRLIAVLEYCREARTLGLELEEWTQGVALRAAETFVESVPLQGFTRQSLDPFVERVLKHRDVALVILLGSGADAAWARFRSLFEDYILSSFLRQGRTAVGAYEATQALLSTLRERSEETGRLHVEAYTGRCDLVIWLSAVIRRQDDDLPDDVERVVSDQRSGIVLSDTEDASLLEEWLSLSESERTSLSQLAIGERGADVGEVVPKATRRDLIRGLSRMASALNRVDRRHPEAQLIGRLDSALDDRMTPFFGRGDTSVG